MKRLREILDLAIDKHFNWEATTGFLLDKLSEMNPDFELSEELENIATIIEKIDYKNRDCKEFYEAFYKLHKLIHNDKKLIKLPNNFL